MLLRAIQCGRPRTAASEDGRQQRRLAGTIVAENDKDLARTQRQIDASQNRSLAIADIEPGNLKNDVLVGAHPKYRRAVRDLK